MVYKKTADELISTGVKPLDAIQAIPILFLYRHYLELELKSVVALDWVARSTEERFNPYDDVDEDPAVMATAEEENVKPPRLAMDIFLTHDLKRLCEVCREVALRSGLLKGDFGVSFEAFQECVNDMASHDPGSLAFRYPIDKSLNPNLGELEMVNLQHLKNMFAKIERFIGLMRRGVERRIESVENYYDSSGDRDRMDLKDFSGEDEQEATRESQDC